MAEALASEANDITLVDLNARYLRTLQDRLDIRTVVGNASYPAVLSQAGADDADLLLAVTASDEINIVACQVASTLFDIPTKIARLRGMDYLQHPDLFDDAAIPIDVLISPEQIITDHFLRLIELPGTLQVLDFAKGRVQMVAVRADHGGPLVGHQVQELRKQLPEVDTRVAAIYRRDHPIIPTGHTFIESGDEVFLVAAREDMRAVASELRQLDRSVLRIMIAGGGNIGLRLARELEQKHYRVKLIERDLDRAEKAADLLDDTVVLHGDASDQELLIQENIELVNVFCAATDNDEINILSAMLAKRLGARRTMAVINRAAYIDLLEDGVIDSVISPRLETAGSILAHIRKGDMVAVHALRRGAAEAIELIVHGDQESSQVVGRTISEIDLPSGVTIGAIVRGEQVLIAHGRNRIETEDHVILFMVDKRHIKEVESLFQVGVTFI